MDPRSKKLLTLLENDCTLTHAQLAAMCDTTVEDIEMRIKSLTDEGVILGYKAMVNWEKTSVEAVEALIEVKITPQRDKGFDRIAQRIYQYEEVESCYLMSGGYDLTVILTGRTLRSSPPLRALPAPPPTLFSRNTSRAMWCSSPRRSRKKG